MNHTKKKISARLSIPQIQDVVIGDVKLVKKANIYARGTIIYLKHYDTIILKHDVYNNITQCNWHCSVTSDRQIRYFLWAYSIDEDNTINTHDGEEWNYGGSLYYY